MPRHLHSGGRTRKPCKEALAEKLVDQQARDIGIGKAHIGIGITEIEDHVDYLVVRIDPDKLTPLKGEAQSLEYLSKPARRGG